MKMRSVVDWRTRFAVVREMVRFVGVRWKVVGE
jgi:hypothetical protein